jgi:hypothetical protein
MLKSTRLEELVEYLSAVTIDETALDTILRALPIARLQALADAAGRIHEVSEFYLL